MGRTQPKWQYWALKALWRETKRSNCWMSALEEADEMQLLFMSPSPHHVTLSVTQYNINSCSRTLELTAVSVQQFWDDNLRDLKDLLVSKPCLQVLRNFSQEGMKECMERINIPFPACTPAHGRAHSHEPLRVNALRGLCLCAKDVELLQMTTKTNPKSS